MYRSNINSNNPVVSDSACVDHTAVLVGKIDIGDQVFIAPYAVIRQDESDAEGRIEPIIIAANSNIQDGVVIHSIAGQLVSVGESTTVAHRAIIHGPATVGNSVFIGFNSVVASANIGDNCFIGHGAIVENCTLPPATLVPSGSVISSDAEAGKLQPVEAKHRNFHRDTVIANLEFAKGYKGIADRGAAS